MWAYIRRMRIKLGFHSVEVFKQVSLYPVCLMTVFLYVLVKDITHFHSNKMFHQVNQNWQPDLSSALLQYHPANLSVIGKALLINFFLVHIILIHSDFKHQNFKYNYILSKSPPIAFSITHSFIFTHINMYISYYKTEIYL